MALEPQWEAKFQPNSYGFRPGLQCHDTIEAIHSSINKKPKYVLDADIRKCFDSINHKALLKKFHTYGKMHRMIKAWIKTGIIDKQQTLFPETGTVQGNVISPFLSNVAVHGMENMLKNWVTQFPAYNPGNSILSKTARKSKLTLVRSADDFVLLHPE
jgi:RNA-directed DNA polymerase